MRTSPKAIAWTDAMISFIKANFDTMTNQQLADALGLTLSTTRAKCYSMGLKRMELEYWTQEQVDFLTAYYPYMGNTEIAETFNEVWPKNKPWTVRHIEKKMGYLNIVRTKKQLNYILTRAKATGTYRVNHHMKHRKCNVPQGATTIWVHENHKRVMVKWSGGQCFGIYDFADKIEWMLHHGYYPPKGMNVRHIDGDPMNINIDNLMLVSDADNARLNSIIASKGLSDNYIIGTLRLKGQKVPKDLIKLKRAQLLLNRQIKNYDSNNAA